jgi:hypothetical protein
VQSQQEKVRNLFTGPLVEPVGLSPEEMRILRKCGVIFSVAILGVVGFLVFGI